MKTRLGILIFIGVLIILATFISIYIYRHGIQGQFDEYIIKYSLMEKDPELKPIDAAIVKAIISTKTNFTSRIAGNEGEMGLMFITKDGAEKFLDYHTADDFLVTNAGNKPEYGFVCPNRIFPNHKNQQTVFPKGVRAFCPICNSRMIQELLDAEINIRVGCWYLAHVNAYLREIVEEITDDEVMDFSLVIFENGLDTLLVNIESQLRTSLKEQGKDVPESVPEEVVLRYLKPYLKTALKSQSVINRIKTIKEKAEKYRPALEKKAKEMDVKLYDWNEGSAGAAKDVPREE